MRERPAQLDVHVRPEPDHHREGSSRRAVDRVDAAVEVGAVEAAVHRDHLSVEAVERAQSEVAVARELGEGQIALVGAVEQRGDRRCLEEHVRGTVGVGLAPAQGLHVQGRDQPLVEHRPSLAGAG